MKKPKKAYAAAGVDVDLGNQVKKGIHALVSATHGPEVLGKIGGFGGLFRPNFRGMKDPVLVSSVDGVGTKLKIAFATNRHDTIGQDLVKVYEHNGIGCTVSDAGCCGAPWRPRAMRPRDGRPPPGAPRTGN